MHQSRGETHSVLRDEQPMTTATPFKQRTEARLADTVARREANLARDPGDARGSIPRPLPMPSHEALSTAPRWRWSDALGDFELITRH